MLVFFSRLLFLAYQMVGGIFQEDQAPAIEALACKDIGGCNASVSVTCDTFGKDADWDCQVRTIDKYGAASYREVYFPKG